jgi:hypothetical protein
MYRSSSTIDLEDKILASEVALHRNPIFHDTPYHLPRRCVPGGRSESGLGWILAEELRKCGNGVVTSKQFYCWFLCLSYRSWRIDPHQNTPHLFQTASRRQLRFGSEFIIAVEPTATRSRRSQLEFQCLCLGSGAGKSETYSRFSRNRFFIQASRIRLATISASTDHGGGKRRGIDQRLSRMPVKGARRPRREASMSRNDIRAIAARDCVSGPMSRRLNDIGTVSPWGYVSGLGR